MYFSILVVFLIIISQLLFSNIYLMAIGLKPHLVFNLLFKLYHIHNQLTLKSQLVFWLLFGLSWLIPLLPFVFLLLLKFSRPKSKLHGDSRFSTYIEVKKANILYKKPPEDGILLAKYKNQYLSLRGQTSAFLAAPPRSGKGVAVVLMNLIYFKKGSVVVNDVKYENYIKTSGFRRSFSSVYLLDISGRFPQNDGKYCSHCWNPFTYVSRDPLYRQKDLRNIANIVYAKELEGKNKFFGESAVNLFVGIASLLFDIGEAVTFSNLYKKSTPSEEFESFPDYILNLVRIYRYQLAEPTKELLTTFVQSNSKTTADVLATFRASLAIFTDQRIAALTSSDSFDLHDLRKKRLSIYLGVLPTETVTYAPLLNLFFSQLIQVQVEQGLREQNPELKHQCLLLIDEFAALGKVEVIQESIAFIPGYDLRLLLIFQNVGQMIKNYTENGMRSLFGSIDAQVIFASRLQKDAEENSAFVGYYTENVQNKSKSKGAHVSQSVSENQQKRALLLPDELKRLPYDDCIVILPHKLPILAQKAFYYKDSEASKNMDLQTQEIPELDFEFLNKIRPIKEQNFKNTAVKPILLALAGNSKELKQLLDEKYPK